MHTKFRPLFILFALFVMGIGCYFFYGLKTGKLFENIENASVGKNIKDEVIEIRSTNVSQYIKRTSFVLEKPKCTIVWDVVSDSLAFGKRLTLVYLPSPVKNCPINQALFESYQLSVLKKIVKTYDPKDFKEIELNNFNDWPFINNLSQLQEKINSTPPQKLGAFEIVSLVKEFNSFKSLKEVFKSFDIAIELEKVSDLNGKNVYQILATSHLTFSVVVNRE